MLLDKTFSNQILKKCVSHLGQLHVQWLLDCASLGFDNLVLESALFSQNFLRCSISCRCNFEAGLCDLTQLANDTFNWRRQAGRTGSSGTGPSFDHTTESSNGKTGPLLFLYFSERSIHLKTHQYGVISKGMDIQKNRNVACTPNKMSLRHCI